MSYLTKAHDQEILDLQKLIKELEDDHSDIYEMLIKKYRAVKNKMLKEINENVTIFVNN
jgi:regulator of sigma D